MPHPSVTEPLDILVLIGLIERLQKYSKEEQYEQPSILARKKRSDWKMRIVSRLWLN